MAERETGQLLLGDHAGTWSQRSGERMRETTTGISISRAGAGRGRIVAAPMPERRASRR